MTPVGKVIHIALTAIGSVQMPLNKYAVFKKRSDSMHNIVLHGVVCRCNTVQHLPIIGLRTKYLPSAESSCKSVERC